MSEIRNSRAPGATSRVILELKPFEISIRGPIGSEPLVGRNTDKMSRNSTMHFNLVTDPPQVRYSKLTETRLHILIKQR